MQLTNNAAKLLLEISKEHEVPASVVAEIRRVVLDDITKQMQMHGASVEQILGEALGYPYYCADQKNFPGTDLLDGVCTGDEVPESLASETVRHLLRMAAAINQVLSSSYSESNFIRTVLSKGLGTFHGPSIAPKPTSDPR